MENTKNVFNQSLDEIHSYFKPGVALSAKTLKKRTGIKHKYLLGVVKRLIKDGRLRRVEPSDVGCNKFTFPSEEKIRLIEKGKRRKNGNEKPNKGEKDKNKGKFKGHKQGKYPPIRRFHVFMLSTKSKNFPFKKNDKCGICWNTILCTC
jgi:hypothetical protein